MENWNNKEKICYIAHIWAEKEKKKKMRCLQDFDYTDMAQAADNFISSFPDNVSWQTHVENCFDKLAAECGGGSVTWTKEYFASFY